MDFLTDFLWLALLFDFCNIDCIVGGPDGEGKRKDRDKEGEKMVRDKEGKRYKENEGEGWGIGREK